MSPNPINVPASLEAWFVRKMRLLAMRIVKECRKNASSPLSYPDVLRSLPLAPSFQSYVLEIAKGMTMSLTSYGNKAWWFRRHGVRAIPTGKRRIERLLFHAQAAEIFSGLLNDMTMNGMEEFLWNKVQENAALISSIPLDMAENMSGWAMQRALQGGTAETVAQEMEAMFPTATKTKFTTIARTEFSKTKSAITELKSLRVNVPAYVWKASGGGRGDGRTRYSHKGMADVIVFWDDAPAPEDLFPMKTKTGQPYKNTLGHYHCGCCPNCRCTLLPLVFMEDLKFPARVYTNGKIIRMNQGDFDKLYRKKVEQLGKNPSKVNDENSSVSLVSDELTHNQRVEQAENQNRDKNGRFSKENAIGQEKREKFVHEKISGAVNKHEYIYYGGGLYEKGGRTYTENDLLGEDKYDEIRKTDDDIDKIAKNTGYPRDIIEKIKKYLFLVPQYIDGEDKPPRFFDGDNYIADSWAKLMYGDPKPHDFTLLKHEIMEMELIEAGMPREYAHAKASEIHNYGKESTDYGKIEKYTIKG